MKLRAAALALMVLPAMYACGDDDGSGPDTTVVPGTYTLRTVNGQPLPFILINQTGYRLEVMSDEYVINGNGTFTTTATFRETEGTTVTTSSESYSGTWQQSGSSINLTSTDADGVSVETGTFSGGNTITFTGNGFTVVYRR